MADRAARSSSSLEATICKELFGSPFFEFRPTTCLCFFELALLRMSSALYSRPTKAGGSFTSLSFFARRSGLLAETFYERPRDSVLMRESLRSPGSLCLFVPLSFDAVDSILMGFSFVPPLIVARVFGERRLRGDSGSFSNGDDLVSFLDLKLSFMRVPSSRGLLPPALLVLSFGLRSCWKLFDTLKLLA